MRVHLAYYPFFVFFLLGVALAGAVLLPARSREASRLLAHSTRAAHARARELLGADVLRVDRRRAASVLVCRGVYGFPCAQNTIISL